MEELREKEAFANGEGVFFRFEKSLYDLIRGLRNHKGAEKEYIQKSLKECRAEVRGQDMGSFDLLHCLHLLLEHGLGEHCAASTGTDADWDLEQTSRPRPSSNSSTWK